MILALAFATVMAKFGFDIFSIVAGLGIAGPCGWLGVSKHPC